MSLFEIQRLTRQNIKLNEKIKQQATIIASLQNQWQTSEQIGKRSVKEKEHLQAQVKELKRRLQQHKYQKEQTQNRYFHVLRKLEDEIEDRKRKYQKLESKIEPLVDHDTVRLKILSEVEGVHFMEIEENKRKINTLKDQILKLKRDNELYKHQLQTQKLQYEEEIRKIRHRAEERNNRDHLNEMSYQFCTEVQNKLRLSYEEARKQSQYYKEKYFSCERRSHEKVANLEKQLQILKERQMLEDR